MATPRLSRAKVEKAVEVYNQCLKEGFDPVNGKVGTKPAGRRSALQETMKRLKWTSGATRNVLLRAAEMGIKVKGATFDGIEAHEEPYEPTPAYLDGPTVTITSRPDNTYCFGALGDTHIGSVYFRQDVLDDLYARYAKAKVQAAFHTGNYVEGVFPYNRHELVASGLDGQIKLMTEVYPKAKFTTFAVTGDDHEGWWAQREGINVGDYTARRMQEAGHRWHDLGYVEAHVILKNYNSGRTAKLAIVHPGGGSAYATSYAFQKIVESYEGGEKPSAGFYGHYHKLIFLNVRNVWCFGTGCTQDQTTFQRKKKIEAHVGALLARFEQDPKTGALISASAEMYRYFNLEYYGHRPRWGHHGKLVMPERRLGGV